jgi:hypothetical protein
MPLKSSVKETMSKEGDYKLCEHIHFWNSPPYYEIVPVIKRFLLIQFLSSPQQLQEGSLKFEMDFKFLDWEEGL